MFAPMKNGRMKRWVSVFLCLILASCISAATMSYTVSAEEKRTVKVAFFPMQGYHTIEEDGSYSGMDVECLKCSMQKSPHHIIPLCPMPKSTNQKYNKII